MIRKESWLIAASTLATLMAIGLLANSLAVRSVGLGGQKPEMDSQVSLRAIAGYRSWTKVNPNPQIMQQKTAILCGIRTAPSGANVYGETNPHHRKYITVYVNETGRKAMMEQLNPKFPEGSVIVKEKLSEPSSQTPELLTVMIRREKGFNPESGDWEYIVVDGTGTKVESRGKLENCQSCHLSTAKTDYIFRTYLPNDILSELK
jgi:hypothetical protein